MGLFALVLGAKYPHTLCRGPCVNGAETPLCCMDLAAQHRIAAHALSCPSLTAWERETLAAYAMRVTMTNWALINKVSRRSAYEALARARVKVIAASLAADCEPAEEQAA